MDHPVPVMTSGGSQDLSTTPRYMQLSPAAA
jgi:hypothetical protein